MNEYGACLQMGTLFNIDVIEQARLCLLILSRRDLVLTSDIQGRQLEIDKTKV